MAKLSSKPKGPRPRKPSCRSDETPRIRESQVVSGCLDVLKHLGFMAWRNNTGSFAGSYKGKRRYVRFGRPGSPDIIGIAPNGLFIGVECKAPGGLMSEKQTAWFQEAYSVCKGRCMLYLVDDPEDLWESLTIIEPGRWH